MSDLKRAGGFDRETLMYGQWTWLAHWADGAWYDRCVQSNYNYRNVPCVLLETADSLKDRFVIKFVKPALTVYAGCPAFKTQKQLGGRALVTDSFSQDVPDHNHNTTVSAGKGIYAHRDGYNVLYGDWSAKWYGDPQTRIMWWPSGYTGWVCGDHTMANTLQVNCITEGTSVTGLPPSYGYSGEASVSVWHLFDESAGIDVQ